MDDKDAQSDVIDTQLSAKKNRRKRLLTAIGIGLIVMIVLSVPVLEKAREKARRVNCAGNLKCAGLAMLMYSGDYDGYFPVDLTLEVLVVENYVQYGKVWWCPSTAHVVTTPSTSSYIYIGSGLRDDVENAESVPLKYDKPSNHGDWINVMFADGHVEGFHATSWEALKAAKGW